MLRTGGQLDLRGPLLVFALAAFIADALIALVFAELRLLGSRRPPRFWRSLA